MAKRIGEITADVYALQEQRRADAAAAEAAHHAQVAQRSAAAAELAQTEAQIPRKPTMGPGGLEIDSGASKAESPIQTTQEPPVPTEADSEASEACGISPTSETDAEPVSLGDPVDADYEVDEDHPDPWRDAVIDANARVDRALRRRDDAETDVHAAKQILKEAQAGFEAAVNELRDVIANRGQAVLPFADPDAETDDGDSAESDEKPPESDTEPSKTDQEGTETGTFDEHSWKGVHVTELQKFGLTAAIAAKLVESGIRTIGDMAESTGTFSAGPLENIHGIGEAKAKAIEDALEKFWADRRETMHQSPRMGDASNV